MSVSSIGNALVFGPMHRNANADQVQAVQGAGAGAARVLGVYNKVEPLSTVARSAKNSGTAEDEKGMPNNLPPQDEPKIPPQTPLDNLY